MNEKLERIQDGIWEGIKFFFTLFLSIFNAVVTVTLLAGSIVSFVLLYKLYPEMFIIITNAFQPVVELLTAIFKSLFWIIYWLVLIYFIFMFGKSLYYFGKDRRKRLEIKREKFLDDLAIKMTKRLKKK